MKEAKTFETWIANQVKRSEIDKRKIDRKEQSYIKDGIQDDETIYETYMASRENYVLEHVLDVFKHYQSQNKINRFDKRKSAITAVSKENVMARRSLSAKEIKDGMAYIYERLVNQNLSARVVSEDPNLPFSLTTYYKYLPKHERQLRANNKVETPNSIIEEEMSPTKAIVRNKQRDELLAEQNQQLQEEINTLNRFIVKKFIAGETGVSNENGSSNAGIH